LEATNIYEVVIVGAFPVGATAAIFTARADLTTFVIDADQGITRRAWIPNHLGFPDGLSGPDLVALGHRHLARSGATLTKAKVTRIDSDSEGATLATDDGLTFRATHVILATGVAIDVAREAGIATRPGTEPRIREVIVTDGDGRTSMASVWAAGTVAGASVHVTITSGDGARVAVNVASIIKGERWVDHEVMPAGAD
jgi:thioredoxin reductase (NADPH)